MSKLRRKFIAALAVLFCALLALSAALMIPKNKSAEAYSTPQSASVGELYIGGDNVFSAKNLRTLYSKLADDNSVKNLADLDEKLSISAGGVNSIANRGILVKFGDKVWSAVYLSKTQHNLGDVAPNTGIAGYADQGDIVLTLWLAYTTQTAQWQHWSSSSDPNNNMSYPRNMYGTSYMRSVVLNNGGEYWDENNPDNGILHSSQGKQTNNEFARFTMPASDVSSSVADYLVAPRYISWQYQQKASQFTIYPYAGQNPDINNESWGKLGYENFYIKADTKTRYCYENYYDGEPTDYYAIWKDDLVWLPSATETGHGDARGLWRTTVNQRQSQTFMWWRSADIDTTRHPTCLRNDDALYSGFVSQNYLVRPAIHLNLTKAAEAAKGVSFDNVKPENVDENSKNVNATDKTHTFTHVYDGKTTAVTLLNKDDTKNNLIVGGDDFDYNYSESTGKGIFSATEPATDEDKTYKITVTPSNGYVWDDNDGKEVRTYEITIKRAKITVDWGNIDTTVNGSLLQDNEKIKLQGNQTPTVTYWIAEPPGTATPPSESDYKSASEISTTAAKTGKYCVYFKIEATYHNSIKGSYDVEVKNGSLTVTVNGDAGSAEYGEDLSGKDWLKEFAQKVTLSSSGKTYSGTNAETFLKSNNIEVYLYSTDINEDAELNGYNRYDVGTYYLGLKDTSNSYAITWSNEKHPAFEITQKEIKVSIVAEDDGELTHIYGNKPVKMKYKVTDDTFAKEITDEFPLTFTIKAVLGSDGDSSLVDSILGDHTSAGSYNITGSQGTNGNFKVTFTPAAYEIKKKEVTLRVPNVTAPYGTDFDSYNFSALIDEYDGLAAWDTTEGLEVEYYIKVNGNETKLSSTLQIKEYDLYARVEHNNYDFSDIIAGKLTITKADFNMKGVTIENKGYAYDGKPHEAEINGELPSEEIKPSFKYVNYDNGEQLDGAPVEIGLYIVYVSFTHNNPNYNAIKDMAAFIRIAETLEEANKDFPDLPTDEEIEAAAQLAKKKAEAKKSLDDVAKAKKEEIAAMEISDEEKAKANSEIDKELAAGNAAIDAAKDASGVEQAFNEGKKKIEDISAGCKAAEELGKKKKAAKDALEQAAKDKNAEIDSNTELTDEEKAEAKAKVDAELQKGKDAIDGATDASGVESAQSTSKANIENIKGIHKENSSFPWWIIAVVAGVLALAAVLIIVIVKRRQTADGDDDYDDYYDDEYDFDEEIEEDDGDDFDF